MIIDFCSIQKDYNSFLGAHVTWVFDQNGNKVTSPDGLGHSDKALLQIIRNSVLEHKLVHENLEGYQGISMADCHKEIENIFGVNLNYSIFNSIQVCRRFALIDGYIDLSDQYNTTQGHGIMLTEKGWRYLEKWGI